MADPVILLDEVSVRLGPTAALTDVELQVSGGELLGVIGPNGSGKSTLLMLLNGLRRATSGCVRVLGREVAAVRGAGLAALRYRIGYVPQLPEHDRSIPLSVRDVVRIGRSGRAGLFHRLGAEDDAIIRKWIDRLDLSGLGDRSYSQLSGGEQRKVHLARALAQQPEILLLDEPASNLDIRWQEELTQIIQQLWEETGVTIVLVTHDIHQIPSGCGRMLLMSRGMCVAVGPPASVLTPALLERVFGSPVDVVERNGRWHLLPTANRGDADG